MKALMTWFAQELLPLVVQSGKFAENGESQTLEKCDFEYIENYVNSFASMPCFARLNLKASAGATTRDILVKFQSQDPLFRKRMRTVLQYCNEVVFYNEVYPNFVEFLKSKGQTSDFIDKIIPKCYFACNGNGDPAKAILILEDLRKRGFRLADSPVDLDLNHCLTAVEKLAQFHAISFAMKFSGWKPFERLKQSFAEVWLQDTPESRRECEDFRGYTIRRGIDYLMTEDSSEVPKEYLENLKEILKPIFQLLKNLVAPREPLSVICHGDFNRNNILYRYLDGEVIDARLIDFQTIRYGSPSLDLGFLLYMNTTQEFREKHFYNVFDHYYANLVKSISAILMESEKSIADRIPIQAFQEDFGKVALYHYSNVAFFLPIMMTPPDGNFEWDIINLSHREMAEKNYNTGGDDVSKRISQVIVDFYRRKFYT